ncbi:MAG: YcxB family protein [Clostridia bacterium]|nr:YcxB family protein [Bacilli bacterium]MBR3883005.1 YcxB family protein [Clostridia bacterium]
MENLFENEYLMERKYYKEYVLNVLCKKIIITGLLVMIFGLIFTVFVGLEDAKIVLTAAIIAGIASILTPVVTIKQLEDTEKRLNNGKIEKIKVIFSDNIVMDEGKVHLEFEYNQITKIVETKSFIVLRLSENSAILVLKDGFVKGTQEEFSKFINEKIK